MAKRTIIKIDEDKCTGCSNCIPNCPEGALQIIDGKVRLISDLFCDGLGACIGHCPEDAITTEERDAEPYDEKKVMVNIVKGGENVIKAHLEHLRDHHQEKYFQQAIEFLKQKNINNPLENEKNVSNNKSCGCPGAKVIDFSSTENTEKKDSDDSGVRPSELKQWPIQLHLVPASAPYFQGKDVILVADCVGYAIGDFHKNYLKGKNIAIACPKLDEGHEEYIEKITALVDETKINTLTVMIMHVPCCRGLLQIAQEGVSQSKRKIPIKLIVVGLHGEILQEEWVTE